MAARTDSPEVWAGAASGVLTALRWEWFRLSRRAPFWVIMGLAAAAIAVGLAGLLLFQYFAQDFVGLATSPSGYPAAAVGALAGLGVFLAVVLASMVFGSDFASGAWRALTARGTERWQVGLAKLLLLAAVLLVFWTVSWLVAAAVGLVAGQPSENPGGINQAITETAGWGETLVQLGASWLVALAYLGLGAVLTTAGRSTAFGLGVGVGIVLVELWVYPLAGLLGQALEFPVEDYTRWTLRGVTSRFVNGEDVLGRWAFLAPVLGYAALCWGLTLYGLHRRDLASGSG